MKNAPIADVIKLTPGDICTQTGPSIDPHGNSSAPWTPESEAERNAIREQLERILSSPLFRKSKRFPNLLRFVVERSLHGHSEPLKERTLGIEVFGRAPDYDTKSRSRGSHHGRGDS